MTQKTIDESKPEAMGIKCYVRCTSNKIDTAKENVRSINLNFDIRVGDELVGKGNNLNMNNVYPDDYRRLCEAFGVDNIDENTPFYAELMTLMTQERRQAWNVAMDRKDKKIDKDVTDVTRDPNLLTEKQEALIKDWTAKHKALEVETSRFLKDLGFSTISQFTKQNATDLIKTMKEIQEEGAQTEEKPKKKDKKPKKDK